MIAYWDTSALLALIYQEPHSAEALQARNQTTQIYAWWWLQIEAHAALLRRGATAQQAAALQRAAQEFFWVHLGVDKAQEIAKMNEKHHLRAAEAGHLFCFKQAALVFPEIRLVCFDRELAAAATKDHHLVWSP